MNTSRRQFTKHITLGAGGVALAPFLRSLEANAAGQPAAMPKRFVFVVKSSGIDTRAVRPTNVNYGDGSRGLNVALKDCQLPSTMQALEPFKNDMMILEGLSGTNFHGNHSSYFGALSCVHSPEAATAATIDCMLGKKYPAPFNIYGFAPNGHSIGNNYGPIVQDTAVYPRISAYGQNHPMPYQASGAKAYRELFGSAVDVGGSGKKEITLQTNLLDFLAGDTKRLAKQISQEEREKLDHYLGAFESVRARNTALAGMEGVIRKNAPKFTSQYDSTVFTDRVSVFFDMASAALIAGLTNVVSIRSDWLSVKYESFGFGTVSVHDIGHNGATANGLSSPEARDMIQKWHFEKIAGLAARLKAVPEGNGTMLDNTMIIHLSCTGEAHHSSRKEWPFVVVGGGAQNLKTAGRYLRYPEYGRNGHRTVGNWYNTLLQANGFPHTDYFGQPDSNLKDIDIKGVLKELMV
ncbi:MAG: DUF1552 domain-containing protein [Verrucomicrobiaceae bacterium]